MREEGREGEGEGEGWARLCGQVLLDPEQLRLKHKSDGGREEGKEMDTKVTE